MVLLKGRPIHSVFHLGQRVTKHRLCLPCYLKKTPPILGLVLICLIVWFVERSLAHVFRLVPCCRSLKLFWPIVALSANAEFAEQIMRFVFEGHVHNVFWLSKPKHIMFNTLLTHQTHYSHQSQALVGIWVKTRCVLPLENLQYRVDNASNLQSWNALSEIDYYRKYRKNIIGLLEFSIALHKRNFNCKRAQW